VRDYGALTREDLDALECASPGCTAPQPHARITGQCHPGYPVHVVYSDGVLLIDCAVCGETVAAITVGAAESECTAPTSVQVISTSSGPIAAFTDPTLAAVCAGTGEYDSGTFDLNTWPSG
jgi:ribosomal protein S27E